MCRPTHDGGAMPTNGSIPGTDVVDLETPDSRARSRRPRAGRDRGSTTGPARSGRRPSPRADADAPSVRRDEREAEETSVSATACATAGARIVGAMPSAIVISPPRTATPLQSKPGRHEREPCARAASPRWPTPNPMTSIEPQPVAYTTHPVLMAAVARAQVQAARRRQAFLEDLGGGVGDAAGDQQHHEDPQRRVRDQVRPLEKGDRQERRGAGGEDEHGRADNTPRSLPTDCPGFHKGHIGRTGPET